MLFRLVPEKMAERMSILPLDRHAAANRDYRHDCQSKQETIAAATARPKATNTGFNSATAIRVNGKVRLNIAIPIAPSHMPRVSCVIAVLICLLPSDICRKPGPAICSAILRLRFSLDLPSYNQIAAAEYTVRMTITMQNVRCQTGRVR